MNAAARFLAGAAKDIPEADRLTGVPHPRETLWLLGHEAAERDFLELFASGKMHHAFLLTGPEGVGKASFAYRAARFLFANGEKTDAGMFDAPVFTTLDIGAENRVAHLVANDAHPDLAVLRRRYDVKTKRIRAEISVEDTREVLSLFEKTAAFGGWRVIIIDAADDLNGASANAILKTLEEPPERAIFFLVAHRPEKLLPTIRSRCRTLRFAPLGEKELMTLLAAFGSDSGSVSDIIGKAQGSIRQALRLGESRLAGFLARIETALDALPRQSATEIDKIAEACRAGAEGAVALEDFLKAVEAWLHREAGRRIASGQGARAAQPFAECWSRLMEAQARIEALNLDRRALVIPLFDDLAALASPR